MTGFVRDAPPWKTWTRSRWEHHRDVCAAYLLVDPGHKPTAAVIAGCDRAIARLDEQDAA